MKKKKKHRQWIVKKYFTNYQSPSDMYKKLGKAEGKKNEDQLYAIIKVLDKMKKIIEKVPKNKKSKIGKNEKLIDIVDNILYFNQSRQGLKILTPNQMLSRLPISLAQLKAGNNSEKYKTEISNYFILCTDQKNLQSNSIKVWLTLFKNGNNLYEHWK